MKRSDPNLHAVLNVSKEPDGSFRQFEWFPSAEIYSDEDILDEFLEHVLEIKFAFVTDRSSLSDFLGSVSDEDEQMVRDKIKQHFGVAVTSDLGYIVDILAEIKQALIKTKGHAPEPAKQ